MKIKVIYTTAIVLLNLLFITACNKDEFLRATSVQLDGINLTGEEIYVSMGDLRHDTIPTKAPIRFHFVHKFFPGSGDHLVVTGASGKKYMDQPLLEDRIKQRYSFYFIGNKDTFNPPAALPGKFKIGFFLASPFLDPNTKIDVAIYGRVEKRTYDGVDPITDEEEIYLIKGMSLNEWRYVDFTTPKKGLLSLTPPELEPEHFLYRFVIIYFAGTKNPVSALGSRPATDYSYTSGTWNYPFRVLKEPGKTQSFSYCDTDGINGIDTSFINSKGEKIPEQPEL